MHELFANVLAKRDLSRAGELFSIEDKKIVDGLTDVVSKLITFYPHIYENMIHKHSSCLKYQQ